MRMRGPLSEMCTEDAHPFVPIWRAELRHPALNRLMMSLHYLSEVTE